MGELEDFRTVFLARQTKAEEAMVRGDVEPRLALWPRRDPVEPARRVGAEQDRLGRTSLDSTAPAARHDDRLQLKVTWLTSRLSRIGATAFSNRGRSEASTTTAAIRRWRFVSGPMVAR